MERNTRCGGELLKLVVWALALAALAVSALPAQTPPPLDDHCIVSVLNRGIQVNADGTWIVPNIPAGFGPVRFRATCVWAGVTMTGQSDLITIPDSGVVNVPPIVLGNSTPIPSSLAVTAAQTTLPAAGQTVQLAVTATYSDGTTKDITASSTGTVYQVSNPALATVSTEGLVTALQSGSVLVQARNEGAAGLLMLQGTGGQTGSDPTNPLSYDLSTSLASIEVKPASFALTENSLSPGATVSQQLQVLGHLNHGVTTLDLTSTIWGTTYSSSDVTICSLGSPDGTVVAGNTGSCTITAAIAGKFLRRAATGICGPAGRPPKAVPHEEEQLVLWERV